MSPPISNATVAAAAPKLQSGTYRIVNAYFLNDLRMSGAHPDPPKPVQAHVYDDSTVFWWEVTQVKDTNKYTIQNVNAQLYANCWKYALPGDGVVGTPESRQFKIVKGSKDGQYSISSTNASLYWGLANQEFDTPIRLVTSAADTANQWVFEAVGEQPPPDE